MLYWEPPGKCWNKSKPHARRAMTDNAASAPFPRSTVARRKPDAQLGLDGLGQTNSTIVGALALHLAQPPGSGTRPKTAEGRGFTATALSHLSQSGPTAEK